MPMDNPTRNRYNCFNSRSSPRRNPPRPAKSGGVTGVPKVSAYLLNHLRDPEQESQPPKKQEIRKDLLLLWKHAYHPSHHSA